jgi:hypothetical protein
MLLLAKNLSDVIKFNDKLEGFGKSMQTTIINKKLSTCQVDNLHVVSALAKADKQFAVVNFDKWSTEIAVVGEWFLCFFDKALIRDESFVKECNRCLKQLISFINNNNSTSTYEKNNFSKRMKRVYIVFIIEVLKLSSPFEKEFLFKELDDLLKKASKGDTYFKSVVETLHRHEIVESFLYFISTEIDVYSASQLRSILKTITINFEDNEKRCTYLDETIEVVSNMWRFNSFIFLIHH